MTPSWWPTPTRPSSSRTVAAPAAVVAAAQAVMAQHVVAPDAAAQAVVAGVAPRVPPLARTAGAAAVAAPAVAAPGATPPRAPAEPPGPAATPAPRRLVATPSPRRVRPARGRPVARRASPRGAVGADGGDGTAPRTVRPSSGARKADGLTVSTPATRMDARDKGLDLRVRPLRRARRPTRHPVMSRETLNSARSTAEWARIAADPASSVRLAGLTSGHGTPSMPRCLPRRPGA